MIGSNERRAQALSRPITAIGGRQPAFTGGLSPARRHAPLPASTSDSHRRAVVENVREKIREVNEKSACKKVGSPGPTGAAARMIAMCQYRSSPGSQGSRIE